MRILEISDLGNIKELYEKKLNRLKEELEQSQLYQTILNLDYH